MPAWLWPTVRSDLVAIKRLALLALVLPGALLAGKANPGAPLIAADLAYADMARTDGEWTATRAVSLPQTEVFTPWRRAVLELGKGQRDPSIPMRWKPEQAWISCDGTAGVTFGTWHRPDGQITRGWYEKVWVKMRSGEYKLLLNHGGNAPRRMTTKPGRKGQRAACGGNPPPLPIVAPAEGTDFKLGASHDQTLIWSSAVSPKGEVRIVISLWNGKTFDPVLEDVAPAPNPR